MGEEECKVCRKWEEDMYWTHFQSTLFCQFLSAGFDQQLVVPKKFANNFKEKLPENVTFKGPSGTNWNIGLITSGDTLLFKHGWKAFVDDHSLEEDDILIFKYNGGSRFDVLIFDGRSLCEREASYFVRKCGHTETDVGCGRKRNVVESSVEVMNDSSHCNVGGTRSTRLKEDDNPMAVQLGRQNRAKGRIDEGDMRHREPSTYTVAQKVDSDAKKGSVRVYPLQYASNRRAVTEEEKEKVLRLANEASNKDSFAVVMRPSHVYKGFYMSIPTQFSTSHLPHKSQDVILRVEENTWRARFYYRVCGGGLTGGWKKFAVENNLEEFDVCLFELAGEFNNALVMDVTIFRVVDEVTPLTRVTSSSSSSSRRGKHSKYPRRK